MVKTHSCAYLYQLDLQPIREHSGANPPHRGLEVPWEAMSCDPTVQELATLAHLEGKINASLALKLPDDLQLWTLTYVRYLCKYGGFVFTFIQF